jgi:hypothetical protein
MENSLDGFELDFKEWAALSVSTRVTTNGFLLVDIHTRRQANRSGRNRTINCSVY